jgi:type VI protein secretion system component Hcp
MRANTIKMRRTLQELAVSGLLALAVATAGCADPSNAAGGTTDDMTGQAVLALSGVPADGTCVQIVAAGNRTVTRNFGASAGATAMFQLTGLPLGQVNFTASAFSGGCPPSAGAVPNWVSDATFTVTIGVSPPALVTLNLVRNGSATVNVGFNDGPDGGAAAPDGGGGSGGGGSGGGGATFKELMQVAGITGETVAASPFTSAFHIDNFTLDAKTPTSQSAGGGGGVGKTVWSASATFRTQAGVAELMKSAATGNAISSVVIGRFTGTTASTLFYKVTLSNVLISSIVAGGGAGDALVKETVTFTFGSVTIEIEGQMNPDGTIGAATTATFDITRNTGPSGGTLAPLELIFGGPAVPPAEAVSTFTAPSETNATSTSAGGGGAGKTTFGDASVTFPFDLTALNILISQFAGRTAPSAEVQLETAAAASPFGTYGFQNLQFHETALSDGDVAVSFGAQSFTWTFGGVTTTFNQATNM